MAEKFCKDCGEYRPVAAFSKNARTKDGLAFYCREHLAARSLRSREARRTTPRAQRRPPVGLSIPDGHKWCPDCQSVLPIEVFVRTVASATGFGSYCKPCHNIRGKRALEKVGGSRTYHLTRRYGITAAEADYLLAQQDGLCAICKKAPAHHVDHDHETGAVRALLCFNCNGGLGQFKDDPLALHAAAYYVQFHTLRQQALAAAVVTGERGSPASGPPVGSQGRPDRPRSDRVTGKNSGSRRRSAAGEADG